MKKIEVHIPKDFYIIAEIGINHNGSLTIAKDLIDVAINCGCNAVKFQKRTVEQVYSKETLEIPRESPWGKTTGDQKKGLELSLDDYDKINEYCKNKIDWFASCWDIQSQEDMKRYNFKYNKIASAMVTHLEFIKQVAIEKKHTLISTGMTQYKDIDLAIEIFEKESCDYTLMHTVSTYPTKDIDCNINMIDTLKKKYNCKIGYSGHEVGLLPSILAVTKGATVIERHITLDRSMYGSDQAASLEPEGLRRLVRDIRSIETISGNGVKIFSDEEKAVAKKLRYFE